MSHSIESNIENNPEIGATQIRLSLDPSLYDSNSEALMKDRGIILNDETVEHALTRTVTALIDIDQELHGTSDPEFVEDVVSLVNSGVLLFGTPVLTNAGREQKSSAACTVLPLAVRNGKVNLREFAAESFTMLDRSIGTGYDLSELDEPSLQLHQLNDALDAINSELIARNQRPVASMATLRSDHPDILNFVNAKRDVDFSKWRFNISVFVDESLFEAAAMGAKWPLRAIDGSIVDEIDASELLRNIAESAHFCGEPGLLFKDRIDRDNPTPQWDYSSTAPCAEVAMAEGEACQFSYINLGRLVDSAANSFDFVTFEKAARIMTRLLDASVELTIRANGDFDLPLVREKRRIGVGISGFADLLVRLHIPYDDPRSMQLAKEISESLDYYSKIESVELAKKRGPFLAFHSSRYTDPEWVARKLANSSGVVPEVLWQDLNDSIDAHGIRHASTTSLPPTGTSSAIIGSSRSLEPLFTLTDHNKRLPLSVHEALTRLDPDAIKNLAGKLSVANAMLGEEDLTKLPFLRTARQIETGAHLNVTASFQSFLDESLAKTINLHSTSTVEDVLDILWSAYTMKLKGVTVFRDNCLEERDSDRVA